MNVATVIKVKLYVSFVSDIISIKYIYYNNDVIIHFVLKFTEMIGIFF